MAQAGLVGEVLFRYKVDLSEVDDAIERLRELASVEKEVMANKKVEEKAKEHAKEVVQTFDKMADDIEAAAREHMSEVRRINEKALAEQERVLKEHAGRAGGISNALFDGLAKGAMVATGAIASVVMGFRELIDVGREAFDVLEQGAIGLVLDEQFAALEDGQRKLALLREATMGFIDEASLKQGLMSAADANMTIEQYAIIAEYLVANAQRQRMTHDQIVDNFIETSKMLKTTISSDADDAAQAMNQLGLSASHVLTMAGQAAEEQGYAYKDLNFTMQNTLVTQAMVEEAQRTGIEITGEASIAVNQLATDWDNMVGGWKKAITEWAVTSGVLDQLQSYMQVLEELVAQNGASWGQLAEDLLTLTVEVIPMLLEGLEWLAEHIDAMSAAINLLSIGLEVATTGLEVFDHVTGVMVGGIMTLASAIGTGLVASLVVLMEIAQEVAGVFDEDLASSIQSGIDNMTDALDVMTGFTSDKLAPTMWEGMSSLWGSSAGGGDKKTVAQLLEEAKAQREAERAAAALEAAGATLSASGDSLDLGEESFNIKITDKDLVKKSGGGGGGGGKKKEKREFEDIETTPHHAVAPEDKRPVIVQMMAIISDEVSRRTKAEVEYWRDQGYRFTGAFSQSELGQIRKQIQAFNLTDFDMTPERGFATIETRTRELEAIQEDIENMLIDSGMLDKSGKAKRSSRIGGKGLRGEHDNKERSKSFNRWVSTVKSGLDDVVEATEQYVEAQEKAHESTMAAWGGISEIFQAVVPISDQAVSKLTASFETLSAANTSTEQAISSGFQMMATGISATGDLFAESEAEKAGWKIGEEAAQAASMTALGFVPGMQWAWASAAAHVVAMVKWIAHLASLGGSSSASASSPSGAAGGLSSDPLKATSQLVERMQRTRGAGWLSSANHDSAPGSVTIYMGSFAPTRRDWDNLGDIIRTGVVRNYPGIIPPGALELSRRNHGN